VPASTLAERSKLMFVYIQSEPGLWTVGFYNPDGSWVAESDHSDKDRAAEHVAWLNGELNNHGHEPTPRDKGGD
jgi:hypothetical protein